MSAIRNNVNIWQILIFVHNRVMADITPSSCGNYKNGFPWTDYTVDHRLVWPNRCLVVNIEPIPSTSYNYHYISLFGRFFDSIDLNWDENEGENQRRPKSSKRRQSRPASSYQADGTQFWISPLRNESLHLGQEWGTRGPSNVLSNGPPPPWTYADKTLTTSVLCDGRWWRCTGFSVSVRFHTDMIKLRVVQQMLSFFFLWP